ncbi:MAG: hypothetical protein U1E02_11630, partial [Hydrogenophaga sp.]|nr:hypothetical protein [Hydrogenophaga sp.]
MHISPLKQEALAIVEQLELFTLLAPYGHAELVGSVVLDLIVKRDIDIHIIAKNPALITQATQLAGLFLENPAITTIRISPYRTMPHGAQALHLALDNISGPSGLWSIDLWLATDKAITGIEKTKYLQE